MNNGAGRMRRAVSVLGILIAAATVIACGDGGGPTSPTPPTPQIPQVAGIYRGPATITSSIVGSVMGYSEMEVVQAGSQVTITGWITIGTDTVPLPAATGTINETGFFSLDAGGTNIDGHVEPTCGTWTTLSSTTTFVGRTIQVVTNTTTTLCGVFSYSATLTR